MKEENSNHLLKPLVNGIPFIVIALIAAWLIVHKYINYTTPLYESTAKIKLADANDGVPNSNLFKNFDVFVTSNKVSTEIEVLKSNIVIKKAIQNIACINPVVYREGKILSTDIYQSSPINIGILEISEDAVNKFFFVDIKSKNKITINFKNKIINGFMNDTIKMDEAVFCITYNDSYIQKHPSATVTGKYKFIYKDEEKLISEIIENLDVISVDKEVPVLRISYKDPNPKKAADVVNALSNAYIQDYVETKYYAADTTVDFLNKQLKEYHSKLMSSEGAIQTYRDKKNIINTKQETETDLRKIADLKKQLSSVEMSLKSVRDLNGYIKKGADDFEKLAPNFEQYNDLLSTEMVKKMKLLQSEKRDLLIKYTPNNEKVTTVDDKIGDLTSYMKESINNSERSLEIKYDELQTNISEAEKVFIGLPEKERTMLDLERNFSLNNEEYRFLHQKKTEAEIARSATVSFHRLITPGKVASLPISPNKTLLTAIALFFALLVSVSIIYLIQFLSKKISTETEIYRATDLNIEKSVPFFYKEKDAEMYFKKWALELMLQHKEKKQIAVCLSSFNNDEGKLFIAEKLGNAFAEYGKKTALISIDNNELNNNKNYTSFLLKEIIASPFNINLSESIKDKLTEFDIILFKNESFKNSAYAEYFLSVADLNFFVIDTVISKINSLGYFEELVSKYQLNAASLIWNKVNYDNSLMSKIIRKFKK